MSSHHIIRENQEPALLICDVEAIDEELLGQLLEWSPIVMTIYDHVDFLLSRGIKIDVVLTTAEIPVDLQEDTQVIYSKSIDSIFEDAAHYLASKKQFVIHILCNENRINEALFHKENLTVIVLIKNIRYIAATSFEKWYPQGQVLVLRDADAAVNIEGLIAVGDHTYHVVEDGFVRIYATDGHKLIIGEQL